LAELRSGVATDPDRVRRAGGGRKRLAVQDATVVADLCSPVEPGTRGDPEAPPLWTAKSLRKLEHMPSSHRRHADWTIDHIRRDAAAIGPSSARPCAASSIGG
jgi:hypothetical protein